MIPHLGTPPGRLSFESKLGTNTSFNPSLKIRGEYPLPPEPPPILPQPLNTFYIFSEAYLYLKALYFIIY